MTIKFLKSKKTDTPFAELSHDFAGYVVKSYDRDVIRMLCASAGINYDTALTESPAVFKLTVSSCRVKI